MSNTPPIQPHQQWTCDVCKQPILTVAEGYVVWNDEGNGPTDLLVIHQGRCDDDSRSCSAALSDFLGSKGIARLTALMSYGPLINESKQIRDLAAFTDFFRRMQLPFYEEARVHFGNPEVRADYSDANEILPYLPEQLESIAKRSRRD